MEKGVEHEKEMSAGLRDFTRCKCNAVRAGEQRKKNYIDVLG